ncbi:hypothetical protein LSH36_527g00007 [Paralvinella palmiformis]|uniref:Uncharacterized protein n=1 Tax=Paralvinella palmiformis TaxID=53620 RepID=A0AAD9MXL3_9ANNE|nr:hypothetical protein LSH36_527g00007 [Paralvinella palmiformis]
MSADCHPERRPQQQRMPYGSATWIGSLQSINVITKLCTKSGAGSTGFPNNVTHVLSSDYTDAHSDFVYFIIDLPDTIKKSTSYPGFDRREQPVQRFIIEKKRKEDKVIKGRQTDDIRQRNTNRRGKTKEYKQTK